MVNDLSLIPKDHRVGCYSALYNGIAPSPQDRARGGLVASPRKCAYTTRSSRISDKRYLEPSFENVSRMRDIAIALAMKWIY